MSRSEAEARRVGESVRAGRPGPATTEGTSISLRAGCVKGRLLVCGGAIRYRRTPTGTERVVVGLGTNAPLVPASA
jgi:hypothetical protein